MERSKPIFFFSVLSHFKSVLTALANVYPATTFSLNTAFCCERYTDVP